ncbi:MAG: hypothetical protein IAE84_14550 [Saprospiraceae bacterium]|nr:hypothetical protein [Saprospiraceae bacterium]HRD80782.1 hypothetical protein [Saprospiraceae bacterium]HRF39404.1 hypothetical protein [Saprospiraceae bacterium]HRK83380.1 hypothetical protein [Saprospiraceae bacterium]
MSYLILWPKENERFTFAPLLNKRQIYFFRVAMGFLQNVVATLKKNYTVKGAQQKKSAYHCSMELPENPEQSTERMPKSLESRQNPFYLNIL